MSCPSRIALYDLPDPVAPISATIAFRFRFTVRSRSDLASHSSLSNPFGSWTLIDLPHRRETRPLHQIHDRGELEVVHLTIVNRTAVVLVLPESDRLDVPLPLLIQVRGKQADQILDLVGPRVTAASGGESTCEFPQEQAIVVDRLASPILCFSQLSFV